MRRDLFQSYAELVRDARLFIQNQLHPNLLKHRDRAKTSNFEQLSKSFTIDPSKTLPSNQEIKSSEIYPRDKKEIPSPSLVLALPTEVSPPSPVAAPMFMPVVEEATKKTEVLMKKGHWELQPMPPIETPSSFYKKLSPFLSVIETSLPILLVLPEENTAHRLFLENVARAITRSFAAASVVLYNEEFFRSFHGKLALIPTELLKNKYPGCQPHKIVKTESFTALPLEFLDKYAEDVHCKRALWTAIQSLFQS